MKPSIQVLIKEIAQKIYNQGLSSHDERRWVYGGAAFILKDHDCGDLEEHNLVFHIDCEILRIKNNW